MNRMRDIHVSKVVLNIGAGEPGPKLDKAKKLLETVSGMKCVVTKSKVRVPNWNVRPGVEMGVKCTMRGKRALEVLKRLLEGVDRKVKRSNFDMFGNMNFGIKEYITVPGVEYDPSIGIIGFNVTAVIERKGYRVKRRHIGKSQVGARQKVKKEEAIEFMKKEFGVEAL